MNISPHLFGTPICAYICVCIAFISAYICMKIEIYACMCIYLCVCVSMSMKSYLGGSSISNKICGHSAEIIQPKEPRKRQSNLKQNALAYFGA